MLHRSFKPAKCKTSLKLAVSRIKLLKNKKAQQVSQLRRELAQLLESGQDRTARIRVEHVVREEKMLAAYDLIEIYCELVVARLPIIESQKNCPIDLKEAVSSIVFATPRCSDIPELPDIRKHFMAKYGKEFISAAVELRPNCGVGRMLVEKLSVVAPDGQTKLKILSTVAEEHNIKWDPTSFEEKELKPPEDLLNGPNTLANASKIAAESPFIKAPPSHDQKRDVPENIYQQNATASPSYGNVVSAASNPNTMTPPASFQPEFISGVGSGEMEYRHGPSPDAKRQDWNMEFKDATAAAQAAAESAEKASMAARAAAELSARGSVGRQYSRDSNKSSNYLSPDPGAGQFTGSKFSGLSNSSIESFHDRDPRIQNRETNGHEQDSKTNLADRFSGDDVHAKRSTGTSFKTKRVSPDEDELPQMQSFQAGDKYTQKGSFDAESIMPEEGKLFEEVSRKKQSGECKVGRSQGSMDSVNIEHSMDNIDTCRDFSADLEQQDLESDIQRSTSYNKPVLFDDSTSDEDEHRFDVDSDHNMRESFLSFSSPSRKSSTHFSTTTNTRNVTQRENDIVPDSTSRSPFSAESHQPSQSSEGLVASRSEDLPPLTFDDSDRSSSGGEQELNRSKPLLGIGKDAQANDMERTPKDDQEHLTSSFNEIGRAESKGKLTSGDLLEGPSSIRRTKPQRVSFDGYHEPHYVPVSEKKHPHSQEALKFSASHKLGKDDVYLTESSDLVRDSSSGEGRTELNFGTLTGGFRNKGYRHPPYFKSQAKEASSLPNSKQLFEDKPISTEQFAAFPSASRSSSSEANHQELDYQKMNLKATKESSSSAPVTYSHSSSDDSEEALTEKPLSSKQEPYIRDVRTRANEKSSSRAPNTYFDSDSGDSEEDLPKHTLAGKGHSGSGFSRRTKAFPSQFGASSASKVRRMPELSLASEYALERKSSSRSPMTTETPKHQSRETSSARSSSKISKPLAEPKATLEESSRPPESKQQSATLPKIVTSGSTDSPRTSNGGTPSKENNKNVSHVHPNLPDYDVISAHFSSLRLK